MSFWYIKNKESKITLYRYDKYYIKIHMICFVEFHYKYIYNKLIYIFNKINLKKNSE